MLRILVLAMGIGLTGCSGDNSHHPFASFDFESAGSSDRWRPHRAEMSSVDKGRGEGSCLEVVSNEANPRFGPSIGRSIALPSRKATHLRVSCWVKAEQSKAGGQFELSVSVEDEDGYGFGPTEGVVGQSAVEAMVTSNEWQQLDLSIEVPEEAESVRVFVGLSPSPDAEQTPPTTFLLDDVQLKWEAPGTPD